MGAVLEGRKRALSAESEGVPTAQRARVAFREWAQTGKCTEEQVAEAEALVSGYRLVDLKGATSEYALREGCCRFEIDALPVAAERVKSKKRAQEGGAALAAQFTWSMNEDDGSREFELELEQCGTMSFDGKNAKPVMAAAVKYLRLQSGLPVAALFRLLLALASCDKYGPPWHTAHWDDIAVANKLPPWPLRK